MAGRVHLERDGAIAVLVIDNPPVNAGSHEVRKALLEAIAVVDADPGIAGAVLIGAGRSFIAGSDIREFDLPLSPPQLPQVIAAIEASPKPYVAALHGATLGGGYELALGCDARIAAPGTTLGLPETALGIIPGAGGTQKLPRLVGTAKAIELVAGATRVGANEALALGMVDALSAGDLRAEAVATARALAGQKRRVIDRAVPEGADAEAAADRAGRRARPHVLAAIHHIRQAGAVPAAEGLANERAAFEALRSAPEARALRHIFFAERRAARGRPERSTGPLPVMRPGVIGSGTMGAGIATAILQAGLPVVLTDADPAALQSGTARIEAALTDAVARGRMSVAGAEAARARLTPATDLAALAPCDLVIEAVFEDQAVKGALFARLDRVLAPRAVIATNTSYLDVDRMAARLADPSRLIGLHFFSPAHVMKLLEIVRGAASSDAAMATGFAVARMLGKQPVEAANGFGFIGNRIFAAYRMACEFMLEDGALPGEVDAALEGFGFAMGPFAVADLSGLDIAWRIRQAQAATRDPRDRYVAIPDRLCEAGRLGRKSGAGYYRYDATGARCPDPEVAALIRTASAEKRIVRAALKPEAIVWRAMAAIVNEAALALADGVALRAGDVDVVLVNGYGFPRWRGGPLHWAQEQDPERLAEACAAFARTAGPTRRIGDPRILAEKHGAGQGEDE
jgi:3-hydroxyacyl-CoA dehydrogenase